MLRLVLVRNVLAVIGLCVCVWGVCSLVANFSATAGVAQEGLPPAMPRPKAAAPWHAPDNSDFHYVLYNGWYYLVYTGPGQIILPPGQGQGQPAGHPGAAPTRQAVPPR
ncbi:MAG: hypothetical protein ABSF26_18600 [Thermoguttaceae bacterium]|jgi:hypothetical protein